MIGGLFKLFAVPEFADVEQANRARTLQIVSLTLAAVSAFWGSTAPLFVDEWSYVSSAAFTYCAAMLLAAYLGHRGSTRAGAYLTAGAAFAGATASLIVNGNVASAVPATYCVVVAATGLLFGGRGTLATAGLAIAAISVAVGLDALGLVNLTWERYSVANVWWATTLGVICIAGIAYAANLSLLGTLARSRRREELLAAKVRELSSSQQRFRALADHTSEMICETDAKGIVLYASPNHFLVMGRTDAELRGDAMLRYVHPDDRSRAATYFAELARSRPAGRLRLQARNHAGEWRRVETTGCSYRNADGALRILVVSRDVTDVSMPARANPMRRQETAGPPALGAQARKSRTRP